MSKMKNNKMLYLFTIYSNLLKTIISTIIAIVIIPITIKYFGMDKYGTWTVINSILAYISMSNLGLSAATSILMNKNKNDKLKLEILKKSINIIFVVVPIITIILLTFNFVYPFWINFFNIPPNLLNEAKITIIILIAFVLLNIPLSLIGSALNGFQKNYIDNIFSIFNSLFSLLSILLVIFFNKSLVAFAIFTSMFNTLNNILKIYYFKKIIVKKVIIESDDLENIEEGKYKTIVILAGRCFLGAIASIVVFNTDNIVISKILGINFVTPYSTTFKLYSLAFTLIYIFNSSIIPLIGKEIHDKEYLKKIYEKTFYSVSILGGLFWCGGILALKKIIILWTGEKGYAGEGVVFFLGAYSYIFAVVNLNYIVINTLNFIKGVALITWLEGGINLIISIILAKKYGLMGIAIGTFCGTFFFPYIFFQRILKKKTNKVIAQDNKFILKHFTFVLLPTLMVGLVVNKIDNSYFFILCGGLLMIVYLFLSYNLLPNNYKFLKYNKI